MRSTQRGQSPSGLEAYLLGLVHYDACLALQQRLVYEAGGRNDGRIVLMICEHPGIITIGRQGSRLHIRPPRQELAQRELPVRWVSRGGGCVAHGPGQLAVYVIVPLDWHGWTVGEFLDRFQAGIKSVLDSMNLNPATRRDGHGLWGRTGQLVAFGVAVKNWITYHGAFINVAPDRRLLGSVETDFARRMPMSSLALEKQQPVKISQLRSLLVPHLAAAFDSEQHQVFSQHPLFRAISHRVEPSRCVG